MSAWSITPIDATYRERRTCFDKIRLLPLLIVVCLILGLTQSVQAQIACNASAANLLDSSVGVAPNPFTGAPGSTHRIRLRLSAGPIQGGATLTIYQAVYFLDCASGDVAPNCVDQGEIVAYAGNLSTDCLYEPKNDGIGNDNGACDDADLEDCQPVVWSASHISGQALPNMVTFAAELARPLVLADGATCNLDFDIQIVGGPSSNEIDGSGGIEDQDCDNGDSATAFGSLTIKLAELQINKTCDESGANNRVLPVDVTVQNTGKVDLVDCEVVDSIYLEDPVCPADIGDPTFRPLTPAGLFNLDVGASTSLTGETPQLTADACNQATVTCDLANRVDLSVTAIDDDECMVPPGELKICKVDQDGAPMAGVDFVITGPQPLGGGTGDDGCITFSDIPFGDYSIDEPVPPAGYVFEDCTPGRDVAVPSGGSVTVTCTNCALPDLKLVKVDQDGVPMEGVTLEIVGPETRQCTTNASGECFLENLMLGTYSISEPGLPEGYKLIDCVDEDQNVVVDVALDCGDVRTITCRNCKLPDVELCKVDTLANPMNDVVMTVTGPSPLTDTRSCTTGDGTSANAGCCTITDLDPGEYAVNEPNPPTGYEFIECTPLAPLACGDELATVTCTNGKLPDLELCKENTLGNPMNDVLLSITGPAPSTDTRSCTTGDGTSPNAGCCTIIDQHPGEYAVSEPTPPDGYKLVDCTQDTAELAYGDATATVTCTNCELPDVQLCKVDTSGTPIDNIELAITGPSPLTDTRSCTTSDGSSPNRGCCTIADVDPGEYAVSEPSPPAGYDFVECTPLAPLACGANLATSTCTNAKRPGVELCKVDTLDHPMNDVLMMITGPAPSAATQSCTTGDGSSVNPGCCRIIDLAPGAYAVSEPTPPAGYKFVDCTQDTVVLAYGDDLPAVTCTNCELPDVELCKKDTSDNPMNDVVMTVTGPSPSTGTRSCTTGDGTSANPGCCMLTDLDPGEYTVSEPTPPLGYDFVDCTPLAPLACGDSVATVTCINGKLPDLELCKQDTLGNPMNDVLLSITGPAPSTDTRSCATGDGTSSDAGCCTIIDLRPGEYAVSEPTPPAGYDFVDCTQDTVVSEYGDDLPLVTCTNCELPDLLIRKVDTLGTPMAGIDLTITGPEARQCTTDASGECLFAGLTRGTYTIDEPTPPACYLFRGCHVDDNPSTLGVHVPLSDDDCGRTRPVSCQNCKMPNLRIEKVDQNDNPMSGISLTLTGPTTLTCTTDADGVCQFECVPLGTYVVSEPDLPDNTRFLGCSYSGGSGSAIPLTEADCGTDKTAYCTNYVGYCPPRSHPGWNKFNWTSKWTANESNYFSVATGLPKGAPSFVGLDDGPQGPGRPDPENPAERILRGFVIAWAVDRDGHQVSWNHLSGLATMVSYKDLEAWEYGAYAYQTPNVSTPGTPIGTIPGQLNLDGVDYDIPFDRLLLDFFASGASPFAQGASTSVMVDTDISLLPMIQDLRQNNNGPVHTKAQFDVWNSNEDFLSHTDHCLWCWDQILLSNIGLPNSFLLAQLQTDKGKARVDGVASPSVCDAPNCCSRLDEQCKAKFEFANNGLEAPICSEDTPLLGVANKILAFSGQAAAIGYSAVTLTGQGCQPGVIQCDVVSEPGTATELPPDTDNGRTEGVGRIQTVRPGSARAIDAVGGVAGETDCQNLGNRPSASKKGSLLVFPAVELRWVAVPEDSTNPDCPDSWRLVQDTFMSITNDYVTDVEVHFLFVNGDNPLQAVTPGP